MIQESLLMILVKATAFHMEDGRIAFRSYTLLFAIYSLIFYFVFAI